MAKAKFEKKGSLTLFLSNVKNVTEGPEAEAALEAGALESALYLANETPVRTGEAASGWAQCAADLGQDVRITPKDRLDRTAQGRSKGRVDKEGFGGKAKEKIIKLINGVQHVWIIEYGVVELNRKPLKLVPKALKIGYKKLVKEMKKIIKKVA